MEVKEICDRKTWVKWTKIHQGWSMDAKYKVIDRFGREFLLRTAKIEHKERFKKEFSFIQEVYQKGLSTHQGVKMGVCFKEQYCFQLLDYLKGDQVEQILPSLPKSIQASMGRQMGKELKVLHSLREVKEVDWEETYTKKISNYIRNYRNCIMEDPLVEEFISFVNEHLYLLKNRPVCQLHGDFHVGNMIVDEHHHVYMIDFNRMKLGDPWYEFNRIYFSFRVSPLFAKGLVEGYFDDQIPKEFFLYMKFYLLSIMIATLPWSIPFGDEDIAFAKKAIKTVYDTYDGLKEDIPKWYKEKTRI